jgi:hypothetical protein
MNYRDVSIQIAGEAVDHSKAIADTHESTIAAVEDENGKTHDVKLEIIEWKRQTKRVLYLCNEHGFPLTQVETRFHVGDFQFSAYLKSSLIGALHKTNELVA